MAGKTGTKKSDPKKRQATAQAPAATAVQEPHREGGMAYLMQIREKMLAQLCPTCKKYADEENWTTEDVNEQACDTCWRKLDKQGLV